MKSLVAIWIYFIAIYAHYNMAFALGYSDHDVHYSTLLREIDLAFDQGDHLLAQEIMAQLKAAYTERKDSTLGQITLTHISRKHRDLALKNRLAYLRIFKPVFNESTFSSIEDQASWYHLQAIGHQRLSQNDSLDIYIDSMDMSVKQLTDPSILTVSLAYIQARSAYLKNDFHASLNFLLEALNYIDQYFPEDFHTKRLVLNGIGIGYRTTNQQQKAIKHHHQTLAFLRSLSSDPYWEATVLNNVGLCYWDLKRYDSAAYYMQEAILGYEKLGSEYEDHIATGLANLAQVYNSRSLPNKALEYANASLVHMKNAFGNDHPDLLLPEFIIAQIYFTQSKFSKALISNTLAVKRLRSLGWSPSSPDGDYFLSDALSALADNIRIKSAIFREQRDEVMLDSALVAAEGFLATIDYAYDNVKSQVSKEVFQTRYRPVFSLAIDNLYEKFDRTSNPDLITQALNWSEKYKALELLFAARKDRIEQDKKFRNLSTSYQNLQNKLADVSREQKEDGPDGDPIRQVQQEIYNWKEKVQKESPKYYQLIFHPDDLEVHSIQTNFLGSNKTLLSYHLTDDQKLFAFVINAQDVDFKRIHLDRDLAKVISSLRSSIYAFFVQNMQNEAEYNRLLEVYYESALYLYSQIVKPFEHALKERVVIIPDQVLAYLPFDLLVTEKSSSVTRLKYASYLVRSHAISYAYSLPHWLEMQNQPMAENNRILAFAPNYTNDGPLEDSELYALRSSLQPLHYNQEEIQLVTEHWNGELWLGDKGTKLNFLNQAGRFGLIHLAMHAKANDRDGDFSYLAFSNTSNEDYRLYANEIYGLNLSTDLLTLSACESGIGELQVGEGMISLARAFSFAGARSLISTSWSVNDASTPQIMQKFYEHLSQGLAKDVALQQAKINYLDEVDNSAAHPFFWAGFNAFGAMHPLATNQGRGTTALWLLGILLLVGGLLIKRRI